MGGISESGSTRSTWSLVSAFNGMVGIFASRILYNRKSLTRFNRNKSTDPIIAATGKKHPDDGEFRTAHRQIQRVNHRRTRKVYFWTAVQFHMAFGKEHVMIPWGQINGAGLQLSFMCRLNQRERYISSRTLSLDVDCTPDFDE